MKINLCGFIWRALILAILLQRSALADPGDDFVFLQNYDRTADALSCGDVRLAQELKAVTLQYYALHSDVLDLSRIEQGFNSRVNLVLIASGYRFNSTNCSKSFIPGAKRVLNETKTKVQGHPPLASEQVKSVYLRPDTPALLSEMVMTCSSDAVEVGEAIYRAKSRGLIKSGAQVVFGLINYAWPAKAVDAIYSQSRAQDESDAGNAAKLMCLLEANTRLMRISGQ